MIADRHRNRTAIVTGGASNIGRSIAIRFAQEGANVIVADVRRDPGGDPADHYYAPEVPTDELITEEFDASATYEQTDVSDPESVDRTVSAAVDRFGGIDILINNAGINPTASHAGELTREEWADVVAVNLDGTFYCTKRAMPHLKESQGDVISIGSVHASEGGHGAAYTATKAGIVNLTRDLAVELGPHSVNVNAICPGRILPHRSETVPLAEDDIGHHLTLLPRYGNPEDIGDAAVFLASEEASFVHGQALYVDGGWTAHRI